MAVRSACDDQSRSPTLRGRDAEGRAEPSQKHFSLSKTEFQDALFETRCSAGMVELVVDNITYTVNGKVVVDGVSFSLCSGEILGVIGPNGAGKTTLLRLVSGILSPTRGKVLIDNVPLHSLPPRERAKLVAYLDAELPASMHSLVRDYLDTFSPTAYRQLAVVGLKDCEWRLLDSLSSGEKRRVMIAGLLDRAKRAHVVVVDEPTAHLDLAWSLKVFRLLERLAREGKIVVFATHDLNLATRYSTKLLLLHQGKQIALGPPQDVLREELVENVYKVTVKTIETEYGTIILPIDPTESRK